MGGPQFFQHLYIPLNSYTAYCNVIKHFHESVKLDRFLSFHHSVFLDSYSDEDSINWYLTLELITDIDLRFQKSAEEQRRREQQSLAAQVSLCVTSFPIVQGAVFSKFFKTALQNTSPSGR